jgi:hypothetical protein
VIVARDPLGRGLPGAGVTRYDGVGEGGAALVDGDNATGEADGMSAADGRATAVVVQPARTTVTATAATTVITLRKANSPELKAGPSAGRRSHGARRGSGAANTAAILT